MSIVFFVLDVKELYFGGNVLRLSTSFLRKKRRNEEIENKNYWNTNDDEINAHVFNKWDKVFKNGSSKICLPLKLLKLYGLLRQIISRQIFYKGCLADSKVA